MPACSSEWDMLELKKYTKGHRQRVYSLDIGTTKEPKNNKHSSPLDLYYNNLGCDAVCYLVSTDFDSWKQYQLFNGLAFSLYIFPKWNLQCKTFPMNIISNNATSFF